jgi:hypothetical protein
MIELIAAATVVGSCILVYLKIFNEIKKLTKN